jgi:hypothetical protein
VRFLLQKKLLMPMTFRLFFSALILSFIGCTEDSFEDDPIENPSYPDLNHVKIPDSSAQPHDVFSNSASIDQSIDALRHQEFDLHKRLWEVAKKQKPHKPQ